MKKLVLAVFIAATSLLQAHQRIVTHYDESPKWSFTEISNIKISFFLASLAAKYVIYIFDEAESSEYLICVAYTHECSYFLKYDKITHECVIEFNACDNSFDYTKFKRVFDSFFLYN